MKRPAALFLAACLCLGGLSGCQKEKEKTQVVVFAAASLTEALTRIGEAYQKEDPNVEVVFNFDSSGTLKTQIQEGAECDLFLSAAPKQMDQLDAASEGNTEGLDFVDGDSRVDLLENKVVLAVPEGEKAGVGSYDELARRLEEGDILLAMGGADVPVGQYAQKIFAYYGLEEETLADKGCLTYGSNVKEVTSQVSEGAVDCGIVYATDAYSAGLTAVDTATEEMCGRVVYPAAVLKTGAHREEAQAFLDYLRGEAAGEVFSSVGFTPLTYREEDGRMDWFPLWNSLRIAALSTVIAFFTGIFAAYYASRLPRLAKGGLDVVLTLPLVLPPTVVGYLLQRLLGPNRLIGRWFLSVFGVRLTMNWWSAVFAAAVVGFPLMYRTARGAFESFDETLAQAGCTLGLSNAYIFWRIRMPVCRQGILAGTVLTFARALGEYGATSMLAGYTPGRTATVSTTVYQLWRAGEDELALRWVLVNIAISAAVLAAVNLLERKREER